MVWLRHNWVTLLLMGVLGYGAWLSYDNAQGIKAQQVGSCERGNVVRLYLQYDARYNANLPEERYRFVNSLLPILDCTDAQRRPLTDGAALEIFARDVKPVADNAGLPTSPCPVVRSLRVCVQNKP